MRHSKTLNRQTHSGSPAMLPTRETLLCRYRYDPLDRLVDCTPSAQATTRRFYLKDRLATEIQDAVQRSIMQHEDQLLAQQQRQSGAVEARLLATDQQRSVLGVLNIAKPHPITYSPYGHRPAENSLLSLLGFNGERPDPVTGCYLLGNGYRAFNPVLMRFNRPDSWSPFGEGGLNGYAYCVGDPLNRNDPNGHISARWLFVKNNIPVIAQMGKKPRTSTAMTITGLVHAEPPTPLGAFGKFQNMPDITEQIIRHLPGEDMVSLASTSKTMKKTVDASAKPVSGHLGSDMTQPILNTAARGKIEGILPRDAITIINYNKVIKQLKVRNAARKIREFRAGDEALPNERRGAFSIPQ
jgi:RHS repeat-associated protein